MKSLSITLAFALIVVALVALYGVFFAGAHLHVFTAFVSAFFGMVIFAGADKVASKK